MKSSTYILFLALIGIACSPKKNSDEQTPEVKIIVSPSTMQSGEPFLFTDDDSTVYVSWIEKSNDVAIFKFSSLHNDRWTEPMIIASDSTWFVNWADYPMIATNGKQFMAYFLNKSGKGTYAYDVKLTSSDDSGRSWLTAQTLNDDKKEAEHGFVTLLPYGDNFFVTWLDGRNTVMEGMADMKEHEEHHGSMSLRAAIVDSKGNKLNEWELDNKTCDCCQTSAAITANGPVVVYRDRSDEEIRDMSIVRLIGDTWTEPKTIHQDQWKIAGCPVNGPRVAADENNLAVAWFSAAMDTSKVNVIFSVDGGATFGKPIRIDEGEAIGRVDIVMIDGQSAMVSWMEGTMIKAAKVHSDGKKESSIIIASSSESRSSGFPQMTKSGNKVVFAWTDDKEKNLKTARIAL